MAQVLVWKDAELKTIGNILEAVCKVETRAEAQEFMRAYLAVNEHAYDNIGYITGYLDGETANRLREWTQAAHPVFGMKQPTAADAFKAGVGSV